MWSHGGRLRGRRAPSPEAGGRGEGPGTWVLAVILALLLTLLSAAFVLTVWGPSGWDTATFAVGVVTLLGTLLFSLNAFKEYAPGQFAVATLTALLIAAAVGVALQLLLASGPDVVTGRTDLRGGERMDAGDEATVTVTARPSGDELRLRLSVGNASPGGTSCVPASYLEVAGGALTKPLTQEVENVTEVTVPVDESEPGVTLTLTLENSDNEPLPRGCLITLGVKRAEYP